jgi:hypothetical protein
LSTADEYRQRAAECVQAAKWASREDVRATLIGMAQRWIDAAAHVERNAAKLADSPTLAPSDPPSTK